MAENEWSYAKKTVEGLLENLDGVLKWSWDDRFGGALAQFTVENQDQVIQSLSPNFVTTYDVTCLGEAVPRVYDFCQNMGGLRSGQLLLVTDPEKDVLLLGAWWPWGNGQTISIRIIPTMQNLEDSAQKEFIEQFKGWFGV